MQFWRLLLLLIFVVGIGIVPAQVHAQIDYSPCPPYPKDTAQVIDRRAQKLVTPTGERIFPMGIYHLSWVSTPERFRQDFTTIADAGFNLVYAALTSEDDDVMEEAYEKGVWIIAESHDPYNVDLPLYEYDNHPAMLAWLAADDFNSRSKGFLPDYVRQLSDDVLTLTPNKMTYISGGPPSLDQYVNSADILGVQTYSIPYQPLYDTSAAYNCAMSRVMAGNGDITVLANLQSFPLDGARPPTATEVRSITYQSLITGVDGILYYAYLAPGWDMRNHPALWAEMTELAYEISVLEPVLVDGILTRLPAQFGLRSGKWDYNGESYYVVINTIDTPVDVNPIPAAGTQMRPQFDYLPAQLRLENGHLVGTMAPFSVSVMIVS